MRQALIAIALISVPAYAQQSLDESLTTLATEVSTRAAQQEKQRIAVLPFRELEGAPTVFGTYLAEELGTRLFQLGNFKIVERQLLDKVLGEQKIEQSGAIDPKTAREVGRLVGVDAIITGSVTDLQTAVSINCRLIDTTTGEVFGAAHAKITKDEDVRKLMALTVNSTELPARTGPALAGQDLGALRVQVTRVDAIRLGTARGIRCTLELSNRDPQHAVLVALHAEPHEPPTLWTTPTAPALRAQLIDDRGNPWRAATTSVAGITFVQAGVHGRKGQNAYRPTDIVRLLRLHDELGRDTDDPSDGEMDYPSTVSFGPSGITTPKQFYPNEGNTFLYGSMTRLGPGEHHTTSIVFLHDGPLAPVSSGQVTAELIVGTNADNTPHYTVQHLTLDHLPLPNE